LDATGLRVDPRTTFLELLKTRFLGAKLIFLGGSAATGKLSPTSDLDAVVLYDNPESTRKETFIFNNYLIETLVTDEKGLHYFFFDKAPRTGLCAIPVIVDHAIVLPESTPLSDALKKLARQSIDAGPAPLSEPELADTRYTITYTVQKLRGGPRPPLENLVLGSRLVGLLGNFYLRAHRRWTGSGNYLAKRLLAEFPEISERLNAVFKTFFAAGEEAPVIALTEEMLAPFGGLLYELSHVYSNRELRGRPRGRAAQ
jgi:hypothetical protein